MNNTIIDTISIWTTAQKLKTSNRGRSASNQSLHGINKLRKLILELAVRGKLIPQNPVDEPASILLKKIAKEKARLVKEGKIKSQAQTAGIREDEKPFQIPDKWEFRHLEECFFITSGTSFDKTKELDNGQYLYVKVADMNLEGNEVDITTSSRFYNPTSKELNSLIPAGSIIFPKRGGAIATNKKRIIIKDLFVDLNIMAISPANGISLDYAFRWLMRIDLAELNTGTSVPQINHKDIAPLIFPVPPLAEQHRIVAKVDELMALCDQLEQQQTDSNSAHEILVETLLDTLTNAPDQAELETAWQRISNHFETLFNTEHSIDRLKQTILQLAVMGKLVPQNPDDEPANVLLKKIAKEKARLVKEGKIKKQELSAEIKEDEKPFLIPKKWVWSKLTDLLAIVTDGDHQAPPQSVTGVPFLVIGNLNTGNIVFDNCKYVSEDYYQNLDWSRKPVEGDILYTVTGSYGISVPVDSDKNFCVQRHVAILKSTSLTPKKYLLLALNSKYAFLYASEIATGIAQKTVPLTGLRKMLIPLPPLAEQHRIVAKVDELFAICDALKERINESQVTQLNLADALVDGAVN